MGIGVGDETANMVGDERRKRERRGKQVNGQALLMKMYHVVTSEYRTQLVL